MRLHKMTTNGATLLHCGQCDDFTAPLIVNGPDATCAACGDVKSIAHDIARHLDGGERVVETVDGFLGYITAPQI